MDVQLATRPKALAESTIAVLDTAAFDQMFRVAKTMAAASLMPDHLKFKNRDGQVDEARTAANCFLVVNQAVRWDMCPFALAPGSYVIGGKLAWEGKVVAGVVNVRAGLKERLSYAFTGSGTARSVTVSGTFIGEEQERSLTGSVGDWATKNPMWTKGGVTTDQKLTYTGAVWWARRHAPELVLGVILEDERLLANGTEASRVVDTSPPAPPDTTPTAPPSKPPNGEKKTMLQREREEPDDPEGELPPASMLKEDLARIRERLDWQRGARRLTEAKLAAAVNHVGVPLDQLPADAVAACLKLLPREAPK